MAALIGFVRSLATGRRLDEVLRRNGNNFDLLRLVAALAVIFGHAYSIAPEPPKQDPVLLLLRFDYSGSLAVKFFFFLSGALTTDSLLRDGSSLRFAVRRGVRILPGLIVCLCVTAFVVGPALTTLPLGTYFTDGSTYTYVPRNSTLTLNNLQWTLPGVFGGRGINGSLWTLPLEVLCYVAVALFGVFGLFSSRLLATVALSGTIIIDVVAPTLLPGFGTQQPDSHMMPACFAIGALCAVHKRSIIVTPWLALALWSLPSLATTSFVGSHVSLATAVALYRLLFYVALFYTAVYATSLRPVVAWLKLPFDPSYGVYLYGALIQQCLHAAWSRMGLHGNQAVASLLAFLVGSASWFAVEKPAIALGAALTRPKRASDAASVRPDAVLTESSAGIRRNRLNS